jgi:hypothetical protein
MISAWEPRAPLDEHRSLDLPKVLHSRHDRPDIRREDRGRLQAALAAPQDSMIFIETVTDKRDATQ